MANFVRILKGKKAGDEVLQVMLDVRLTGQSSPDTVFWRNAGERRQARTQASIKAGRCQTERSEPRGGEGCELSPTSVHCAEEGGTTKVLWRPLELR
jgi:hypothetical protein